MPDALIVINQSSTETSATLLSTGMTVLGRSSVPVASQHPDTDRYEYDPETIWQSVLQCITEVREHAATVSPTGIAITNQRETTLLWDRATGDVLGPAISWEDRRTEEHCQAWRNAGLEDLFQSSTGLLIDPMFSAGKLNWLLDNIPGARERARAGELCFGTVDSFLLWRLTDGAVHATDITNAARTQLFNIHRAEWDRDILEALDLPESLLPQVMDNDSDFGTTAASVCGLTIPVVAMIGDQQSAMIGQGCTFRGAAKATYGKGCFILVNTGEQPLDSQNRLLATIGYRCGGQTVYAAEGNLAMAGEVVHWLRDSLQVISERTDLNRKVEGVPLEQPEIMVPSFTGMGTTYWNQNATGAILGLTRDTDSRALLAAGLRSIAFQSEDLLTAMRYDNLDIAELRVTGDLLGTPWFLQNLADITGLPIVTPERDNAAVLGAAILGSLHLGWIDSLEDAARLWHAGPSYGPTLSDHTRDVALRRWNAAVARLQAPIP